MERFVDVLRDHLRGRGWKNGVSTVKYTEKIFRSIKTIKFLVKRLKVVAKNCVLDRACSQECCVAHVKRVSDDVWRLHKRTIIVDEYL